MTAPEPALPITPNCDNRDCIAREVLDVLASRWGLLIMRQLTNGTKRNAQLRDAIGGISEKMLAQTLRDLERIGLITRTVYPVVPPRVEYALTPLGHACADRVADLLRYIEAHGAAFLAARDANQGGDRPSRRDPSDRSSG